MPQATPRLWVIMGLRLPQLCPEQPHKDCIFKLVGRTKDRRDSHLEETGFEPKLLGAMCLPSP